METTILALGKSARVSFRSTNRNGPTGMIKLKFSQPQVTFYDWEEPDLWEQAER